MALFSVDWVLYFFGYNALYIPTRGGDILNAYSGFSHQYRSGGI